MTKVLLILQMYILKPSLVMLDEIDSGLDVDSLKIVGTNTQNIIKAVDEVINESDTNLQLTFDENLFIEMIQDLENKSDGKFLYKDACELVFIGVESDGGYDFNNFQNSNTLNTCF